MPCRKRQGVNKIYKVIIYSAVIHPYKNTSLRVKRSNPEDWSTHDHKSRSVLYCGVNVHDETGKMSHSDKRGATLPKVATVAALLRNDNFGCIMPRKGCKNGSVIFVRRAFPWRAFRSPPRLARRFRQIRAERAVFFL